MKDGESSELQAHYDAFDDSKSFKPHATKFDSHYVQQYYAEIEATHRQNQQSNQSQVVKSERAASSHLPDRPRQDSLLLPHQSLANSVISPPALRLAPNVNYN